MESSYLEDQKTQVPDKTAGSNNDVPLISPQSTLPENSGSTLKPPPGFTKPMEPTNYAAFMDECLHGRSYNAADVGKPTFFNFCDVNLSTPMNPLHTISYLQQMQLIQLWKQQVELMDTLNQFVLSTGNAALMNSTVLNNSSTISPTRSPASGANSFVEKRPKNPFETDKGGIAPDIPNIPNNLDGSIDSLANLTLNDSNRFAAAKNSTTLPNVSSRESTLVECEEEKLFPIKPTEGFGMDKNKSYASKDCESIGKRPSEKRKLEVSEGNMGGMIINEDEFIVNRLHPTNPFKKDIMQGLNTEVKSCKEKSLTDFRPPIPPRNFNLVKTTGNVTAKDVTDVTSTALPVYNNLQSTPTTKIHYRADPVFYNLRNEKTNETTSKLDKIAAKLTDSVSFRGNDPCNIVNSTRDPTNHLLSRDELHNFDKTNSLEGHSNISQSRLDSRLATTQTHNISPPSTKVPINQTLDLSGRSLSNNYRPPPPPCNNNNSVEYLNRKTSPIPPRFTSPVVSESLKTTIEGVHKNLFDKLESSVTEKSFQNLGACGKQSSSSSSITTNNTIPAKTTPAATSYCQSSSRSNTPYKINLMIPKFLPGEQSTVKSEPELSDTLYQTIKPEQISPDAKAKHSTLQMPVEDHASRDLNEASSKSSETPELWRNSFQTLHPTQSLANEQPSLKKEHGIASNGDVTEEDKNCLKFSNTQPGSTLRNNASYSYQPPPHIPKQNNPLLYPNIGNPPHAPNHPYHMPQPDLTQHQHSGPRVPLFRPNVHGFYPPGAQWQRPQCFNPAFPYAPNNAPPLLQQPYPWNPRNSHVFLGPQTPYMYRATIPNLQTRCETDLSKESLLPGLNLAEKVGQESKEDGNSGQNNETPTEVSELTNHTTDQSTVGKLTDSSLPHVRQGLINSQCDLITWTDENVPVNGTEKFVQEGTTSRLEYNTAQIASPGDCPKKSLNGHVEDIAQYSSPRAITNVFKTVEVNKQTIYLFNIEKEGWVCTDEIAGTFTPYENRDTILRCLELAGLQINFKEVSRAQSPLLFAELDGTTVRLPRMKNSRRIKGTLHLTPLKSLKEMMFYLRLISPEEIISLQLDKQLPPGSKIPELVKLIAAYKSNDEYWVT